MSTSDPGFQNIKKLYICVSKNHHIYPMNTYIYSEYSCKTSLEIAFYFELQEKKSLWLRIGADVCQKFVFFT
jgi:hypothetical protein